jgi:hypothetical protein
MTSPPQSPQAETPQSYSNYWNGVTLMVALVGVAGSLWLSMGMQLKACPLCFYQRTFVMAAAAVLLIGLLARVSSPGLLSLLCLPLVAAGLGLALFHVNLERTGILECPSGLFDWGTAPRQSLCVYVVLAILVVVDLVGSGVLKPNPLPAGSGIVVGALLALSCATSNPPFPKTDKPYPEDQRIDICRPVYRAPSE